jgi:hypothetical protein
MLIELLLGAPSHLLPKEQTTKFKVILKERRLNRINIKNSLIIDQLPVKPISIQTSHM